MLKEKSSVLLFIGDEDYQLIYYSNIIQSYAILFEIVNHITSLFFLLLVFMFHLLFAMISKFMCKFKRIIVIIYKLN